MDTFKEIKLNTTSPQNTYLPYLLMIYTTLLISTGVYVNKTIVLGPLFTSAAAVTFPITFVIADIIAEVYGYSVGRRVIWMGLFCQFIFALISLSIVHLPSPAFWQENSHYQYVLGNILYVYMAALIAAFFGDFINIYLVSKLKVLFKGKYFWLRSVAASAIGKLAYTTICASIIYHSTLNSSDQITMIVGTYLLSMIYICVLATPATIIAAYLKRAEKIDVYDYHTDFNPLHISEQIINKDN